jgi:hypothetical protein
VYQYGATSTGVGRTAAAWLGVLVLACGRPDDGSSLPANAGAMGEGEPGVTEGDPTSDAGAPPPHEGSVGCPEPPSDAGVVAGWARDPATGECYPYVDRSSAPNGWLRFDLEAACETECLCSALEGFEGDFDDLSSVRDSSLECRCSMESCPSTLEEAERSLCAVTSRPVNVQRFVGCGVVAVFDSSGYAWVFEQPSESGGSAAPAPRLVGAAKFGDACSSAACSTSSWTAGINVSECDYGPAFDCQLCGDDPNTDFPPCE